MTAAPAALPASPAYTVRFRASYGEMYRALLAINSAIPSVRRMRRIAMWLAAAGVLMLVGSVLLPGRTGALVRALAIFPLFFPVLLVGLTFALPAYLAWLLRRGSATWAGEQEYAFTETGIRTTSATGSGFLRWDAIMRVAETRRFVLFFTSDQSGHFVPKRTLANAGVAADFADFVRAHAGRSFDGADGQVERESTFSPARVSSTFAIDPMALARVTMIMSRRSRLNWPMYLFMVALTTWTTGPTVYRQWMRGGWEAVSLPFLLVGLVPLVVVFTAGPIAARYAARRQVRTGPSSSGPQTVSVHDEGIGMSGPLHQGEFRWASIHRIDETEEFFLFMLSKAVGVWLPKQALSAGDVALVRQLARGGVGERAALLG